MQVTVEAGLPPSPTPDAAGFGMGGFDGVTVLPLTNFTTSPGGSRIEDLNKDGLPDVLLDFTEYYVFCYACGVTRIQYQVLSWDGDRLSEVNLTPLPETAPAPLRDLTHRAVELAEAGLWQDAHETINQAIALDGQDPLVTWDAALIRLHAEERAEQAREPYPLLGNVFYGDYGAALDVMRPYSMEEIFDQPTPLVDETPAIGWEAELSQWIIDSATPALQVQPELAAAFFLRGWARHLANPNDPETLADIEQAAKLDPEEPLFTQSLIYLKQ